MALISVIDRLKFAGGADITPDPNADPEIADLIITLQEAINAMGGTGVYRARGTATVLAGAVFIDVVFATPLAAGTVRVVGLTPVGQNVNVWASAKALTGFRCHSSAILGVDCDVDWEAVAE